MKNRDVSLYCPFEDCSDHEEIGKGNIVFVRKYGKGDTQNLFKCRTCGRTFSERRGTPLFNCKLEEEKVYQIVKCLAEGKGVRATARIVDVNKDTVGSVLERFGEENIERVMGYLLTEERDDAKVKKFLMVRGH
jgi:transposase-like protein